MSDNIELNLGAGGAIAATDNVDGVHFQKVKLDLGGDGVSVPVAGTMPISGTVSVDNFPAQSGLTDAQLRAAPLPVADDALLSILKLLIARVQPLSIITGAGSNRLSVDVNNIIGGTVTTVTGVTNVTNVANVANQAQMGGVTAFGLMHAASRTAFNTGTRTRL